MGQTDGRQTNTLHLPQDVVSIINRNYSFQMQSMQQIISHVGITNSQNLRDPIHGHNPSI